MGRKLAVGKKPEMTVGRKLAVLKKLAMGKKPEMAMRRKLAVGKKPEMAIGEDSVSVKETGDGEETGDGNEEDSFSAEETGDCNGDSIGAEDAKDKAGPRQSGLALFPALQGTQMTSEKNERREGIRRRRRMDLSSSIIFSGRRGEMERENDGGS
ncbi:hypothetical protein OIU78_015378 [Salix suchowensis]|nr:hypothetical protein OIU78_015378 [Salix suchowensis]